MGQRLGTHHDDLSTLCRGGEIAGHEGQLGLALKSASAHEPPRLRQLVDVGAILREFEESNLHTLESEVRRCGLAAVSCSDDCDTVDHEASLGGRRVAQYWPLLEILYPKGAVTPGRTGR